MEKEAFKALLKKYENGQCTAEEIAYVESWFLKTYKAALPFDTTPDYDAIDAELRSRLELPAEHIAPHDTLAYGSRVPRVSVLLTWRARVGRALPYVAAILFFLSIGVYWYTSDRGVDQQLTSQFGDDVMPGGNRATLTLVDGRIVELSESQEGIIVGDQEITYNDGNTPVVMLSQVEASPKVETLTLTTPKGGQYQVTLPDGSKVWLNAASTLKYPSRFSDSARIVYLEGEAYFEVASLSSLRARPEADEKSSKRMGESSKAPLLPFRVISNNQTVEVLGTEFNISAYADENEIKTTLVEGSVKVMADGSTLDQSLHTDHRLPIILRPGQQSTVRGAQIRTQKVDVNEYTAWKDGLFILNNVGFTQAIRLLERWYDVEFVGEVESNAKVSAILPRTVNLSDVLSAMAENTNMKFTIAGRRIMVQH